MSLDPSPEEFCRDARPLVEESLRAGYPYMETNILQQIMDRTMGFLCHEISEALPAIEASRDRSNFFSLPREIRDFIYELAAPPQAELFDDDWLYPFGLLQTCRQVREEFAPVYYPRGLLLELVRDDHDNGLWKWLTAIGEHQAALIKHIELKFRYTSYEDLVEMVIVNRVTDEGGVDHSRPHVRKEHVIEYMKLNDLGVPLSKFSVKYDDYDDDDEHGGWKVLED